MNHKKKKKKKKDYKDQGRSIWKTSQHLERIFDFSQVYSSNGTSLYHSPEIQEKISLALTFWLQNDFTNPNCKKKNTVLFKSLIKLFKNRIQKRVVEWNWNSLLVNIGNGSEI